MFRRKYPVRFTLKAKITISFIAVILAVGFLTTVTGINLIGIEKINEAQNKVKLDLNSAHESYYQRLHYIRSVLECTSMRKTLKSYVENSQTRKLKSLLDEIRENSSIEVLNITDEEGKIITRSRNISFSGDDVSSNPVVKFVLENRASASSTELIPIEQLKREGPDLASRAEIELVDTPKAKPTDRKSLKQGLMLLAAHPLVENGKFIGVIYGGDLLNMNYRLVDKIKDVVYRNQKYKGVDTGTATIFQDDVRISTNVMDKDGNRAIGTRVSEAVRQKVLDEGQKWIDEAFVVNDWYITAYEPIKNIKGSVIGILYVGMLKKPFRDEEIRVVTIFLAIALLGVLIAIFASNFVAGRIARPLRRMRTVAQEIAAGDYTKKIDIRSQDVVGQLATAFNTMTSKLIGVQKELEQWVTTLEDRVEERTSEIKEMQKELIHVEKMASVGRLAAGVAHEINNPLTGILTNASLLMEEFPEGDPKHEDLKVIVNETIRCRNIVKDLLDFSRQTKPEKKMMNINGIIDTTCELVKNQVSFKNVSIRRDLVENIPDIMLDKNKITQVFMNMLLNAADALPRGGDITVRTFTDKEDGSLIVQIADTGEGIDEENIDHLFDPFFSTKTHGTGLGLAISYGFVQQHGGEITVKSKKGEGTTFSIRFPLNLHKIAT